MDIISAEQLTLVFNIQLWKNPVTKDLSFQVHPGAAAEIIISPLPNGIVREEGDMYPDGAHIKKLKDVRDLLYKMQRPGIAPSVSFLNNIRWKITNLLSSLLVSLSA